MLPADLPLPRLAHHAQVGLSRFALFDSRGLAGSFACKGTRPNVPPDSDVEMTPAQATRRRSGSTGSPGAPTGDCDVLVVEDVRLSQKVNRGTDPAQGFFVLSGSTRPYRSR